MSEPDLKRRTKAFALRVLKLVDALPKTASGRALGSQLVRSGTSVAANYRAARRAKSTAHFLSKLRDVEEEADETLFWLELLEESGIVPAKRLSELKKEADELVAIIVASINTAKRKSEVGSRRSEVGSEFKARPRFVPTSDFRLPTS
jgi:four helix bundle protein